MELENETLFGQMIPDICPQTGRRFSELIPELEIIESLLANMNPPKVADIVSPAFSIQEEKKKTRRKTRTNFKSKGGTHQECDFTSNVLKRCYRTASFGYPGEPRRRCARHAEPKMERLYGYHCQFSGCRIMATFGFPPPEGTKLARGELRKIKTSCIKHSEPEMVNIDRHLKGLN